MTQQWWTRVIMYLSTPGMSPHVNYGLWVLISYVDAGLSIVPAWGQEPWGNSVLSAQFCGELKMTLKDKIYTLSVTC